MNPQVWVELAGVIVAIIVALGSAWYAHNAAIRVDQTKNDRIEAIEKWQRQHETDYKAGVAKLIEMDAGMSKGASTTFARLEKNIDRVVDSVEKNSTQIAEVSGQVKILTSAVTQLIALTAPVVPPIS